MTHPYRVSGLRSWGAGLLLWVLALAATAAVPVHIVRSDLKPLIRAAFESKVQFAVVVPYSVSAASAGTWTISGAVATWTYAMQVPTAVSLSFHAIHSSLPPGAALVVRGARTTTSYQARDIHRGELWSRIHPGEALQLELSVPVAQRAAVAFNIVALQAGYRSIGAGVSDHPYFKQLQTQRDTAGGNTTCVTNYECRVTSANTPPGAATVGVVVGNIYQCTGTLINDVPGDNKPYLLTARHCETGTLGGGDPGAAGSVTIYWDATSACGAALGSLYDPGTVTQGGAETVVEQQDAWLLMLLATPVVGDAQFAGLDASGGAVQGGYTIHHAEGNNKQFTGWFGQAAAVQQSNVLGSTYLSKFWEVVNAVGNIGPGASGSALFDQNNHLVGSLTLGRQTSDPSGYESCPVSSPAAPNGSNGAADFTALAAVWNSTADTSSTTGSTTLKSVLDPANTGALITSSAPVANIQFSGDSFEPPEGTQIQLSWTAPNALGCTASGGVAGDGWSGSLAASGFKSLTETSIGAVVYTLNCTYPNGGTARTATTVDWSGPTPLVQLSAPYALWTTRPAVLSWNSNVAPCAVSGGGLSQSNLAASGSVTTTQATAGEVTYTLTCGPANNQGSTNQTVLYVVPSVILEATGTDRILGQTFTLQWQAYGDTCVTSGGAPGDGWAGNAFATPSGTPNLLATPTGAFSPQVSTVGTYTYTVTCSAGSLSENQSVTVTFENDAPYVTASISPTTVTYSNSPADYTNLSWNSNVSTCLINSTIQNVLLSDPLMIAYQAQGSAVISPPAPGTYPITVTCAIPGTGTRFTSTPVTLTVLPPPAPTATLSVSPPTVVAGQTFTIAYSSTNALNCTETGSIPGADWTAGELRPPSATLTRNTVQPGQSTFGISCQSIDPNQGSATAQVTLTVQALTDSLTATPATLNTGDTVTLNWSSNSGTSCTASGGGANGSPWTGTLSGNGSVTQTATTVGTFTYVVNCGDAGPAQAAVRVTTPSSTATGGSGSTASTTSSDSGKHGGGALDWLDLALLTALCGIRAARRVVQMR